MWAGADYLGFFVLLIAALLSPPLSRMTVEGNSDELDEPIKAVFADVAFVKKHNLMSLNSINWSRILVQMAHHFFAYFQCVPSLDMDPLPPVEVVVPTGAAGNLAGKETPGLSRERSVALVLSAALCLQLHSSEGDGNSTGEVPRKLSPNSLRGDVAS